MGRGEMLNTAEKAVARTLRAQDIGYKEIARYLGKSATAVGNVIRNAGVAKKLGRPKKVNAPKKRPPVPTSTHPVVLSRYSFCLRCV